jgi:hypothetical protein
MFRICRKKPEEIASDAVAFPVLERPDVSTDIPSNQYQFQLIEERRRLGVLAAGSVREIRTCGMRTEHLYLLVLDHWKNGGSERSLRTVLPTVFEKAEEAGARDLTIALPEAEVFGIPRNLLADILREVSEAWTREHDLEIIFANLSKEPILLAQNLHGQIFAWLDRVRHEERVMSAPLLQSQPVMASEMRSAPDSSFFEPKPGFQETLFELIDARGEKDADVYHRANLDRRLFSRIRSEKDYHPKKDTAVSLALALHLSSEEADDLLERAGYAFSPASRRDLILEYCIDHQIYDLFDVDALLCDLNEKCL